MSVQDIYLVSTVIIQSAYSKEKKNRTVLSIDATDMIVNSVDLSTELLRI